MDIIGSQISLTSRSDQFPHASSYNRISRPLSAALSCKPHTRNECSRPKSAEFCHLNASHNSFFQHSSNPSEIKSNGDSSLALSQFTDSSSKLLLHLIKVSDERPGNDHKAFLETIPKDFVNCMQYNHKITKSVREIKTSNSLISDYQNNISSDMYLNNYYISEGKKENSEAILNEDVAKSLGEPLVRFSENKTNKSGVFNNSGRCTHKCRLKERRKFQNIEEPNILLQKSQGYRRQKVLDNETNNFKKTDYVKREDIKMNEMDVSKTKNKEKILEMEKFGGSSQSENDSMRNKEEISSNYSDNEETSENENSKMVPKSHTLYFAEEAVSVPDILTAKNTIQEKSDVMDSSFITLSSDSSQTTEKGIENITKSVCFQDSDSTYDEMIQLLRTLEEEKADNYIVEKKISEDGPPFTEIPKNTIENISEVFAYLEEVEKGDAFYPMKEKEPSKSFISPSLEKLLSKTSVELAHEVLTLEIQIEDQKKGIKLLKDTIAEMKEAKRVAENEHQEALHKTSSEAETLVKRHQKFIKQLLNEKKDLSETVSKMVQELKSNEERHKINMKALEEKHLIEVKKAKETQACADKIKREKWMEMKTQKIKEMTVKGLEPELSRMAAQQQQELTELRNLHRAEIEAIELKAARRTSELMDQLRTELTKEKENAITDKMNSLRSSMEREFEEERSKFHQNCQSLKQRIRKFEEKLSSQETEFHLNLLETKQEMEKEKQKLARIHQENLEEVKRRHSIELNSLRETLEAEKQLSLKNQEKQLAAKFLDKETELHNQYKRERDREIEMVIETFEKEQTKIQSEMEMVAENKLKRIKEKLESEIKDIEANNSDLKTKLSFAKSEVLEKEETITQLNSHIRQLETEIGCLRTSCENMISEKARLKEMIRSEFHNSISDVEKENRSLQNEILDLKEMHLKELAKKDQFNLQTKNEMQKEMATVYSRIKSAIGKKDKVIETLKEENKAINERYKQLEMMLDRQRRNLLLQGIVGVR